MSVRAARPGAIGDRRGTAAADARGDPRHGRAPVRRARRRRRRGARPGARDGPHGVEPLQPLPQQAGALRGRARARPPADRRARAAGRGRPGELRRDMRGRHGRPAGPRTWPQHPHLGPPAAAGAARGDRQRAGADPPLAERRSTARASPWSGSGAAERGGTPTRCRTSRSGSSGWCSRTSSIPPRSGGSRLAARNRSTPRRSASSAASSRRRFSGCSGPARARAPRSRRRSTHG